MYIYPFSKSWRLHSYVGPAYNATERVHKKNRVFKTLLYIKLVLLQSVHTVCIVLKICTYFC